MLVATFGSLRWGEVTALRRADVDELHDVVRVRSAYCACSSTGTTVSVTAAATAGTRVGDPPHARRRG